MNFVIVIVSLNNLNTGLTQNVVLFIVTLVIHWYLALQPGVTRYIWKAYDIDKYPSNKCLLKTR